MLYLLRIDSLKTPMGISLQLNNIKSKNNLLIPMVIKKKKSVKHILNTVFMTNMVIQSSYSCSSNLSK